MKQLTLNEIAPYLPFGLKLWNDTKKRPVEVIGFEKDSIIISYDRFDKYYSAFGSFKPILTPLSSLSKTITIEGKEIIPIVELAKIYNSETDWILGDGIAIENTNIHPQKFSFQDGGFATWNYFQVDAVPYQLQLFQKLYEWKIDLHGLIESGLAIDATTLTDNVY